MLKMGFSHPLWSLRLLLTEPGDPLLVLQLVTQFCHAKNLLTLHQNTDPVRSGSRRVSSETGRQRSHLGYDSLQLLGGFVASDGDIEQLLPCGLLRLPELLAQLLGLLFHPLYLSSQVQLNRLLRQLIRADLLLQTEQFLLTGSKEVTTANIFHQGSGHMTTRGAHLQPLCSFHFFVGGLDELPVGGDQFPQTFLLAAAELLVLLSLEVVFAAQ